MTIKTLIYSKNSLSESTFEKSVEVVFKPTCTEMVNSGMVEEGRVPRETTNLWQEN